MPSGFSWEASASRGSSLPRTASTTELSAPPAQCPPAPCHNPHCRGRGAQSWVRVCAGRSAPAVTPPWRTHMITCPSATVGALAGPLNAPSQPRPVPSPQPSPSVPSGLLLPNHHCAAYAFIPSIPIPISITVPIPIASPSGAI